MWNNFFFQNSTVYYWFLFCKFLKFSFQFHLSILVKKFWKFLCFFILWIRDFMKDFWKIMEQFSKKYRHLKSKKYRHFSKKYRHLKFHCLIFLFFYFFTFLTSFFPISPNQTCQKILIMEHFSKKYRHLKSKKYRFYQIILENSWILI